MDAPERNDGLEAGRDRAWELLDLLPKGASHPSLAATTIEMVAVTTAPGLRGGPSPSSIFSRRRLGIAAALLVAAVAAGFAAGSVRRDAPPEEMPAVTAAIGRRMPVLREAGSVEFLEILARREIPPPRRFVGPRGPAFEEPSARQTYPELEAAIADFRAAFAADAGETRPPPNRHPAERQGMVALARALADPSRTDLVDAASRWHQWVLASDPVERRILPTLNTKERIEWLMRRARRGTRPPPG